MKDFVKHTAKGIVFMIGFLFLLKATSQIVIPKNNDPQGGIRHSSANGILSEPENTIDVLILGDSESYRSIIPMEMWEEYGITSYCCGSPAQRLFESEDFLETALKTQSPKLVILETNTIFRQYKYEDMLMYETGLVLPVFEYHNRWKKLSANDFQCNIEYTYVNDKKGYQYKTIASEGTTDGYMSKTKATTPIPEQNRIHVERIKKFCDEQGIKLILLSTPSTKNWNMRRHNSMVNLSKELGVEYIDTNTMKKKVPIDWTTDTYDKGDHMNHFGAKKVTAYLGKYLMENELVESHKDDPRYSYWNDQLVTFKEKVEEAVKKSEESQTDIVNQEDDL